MNTIPPETEAPPEIPSETPTPTDTEKKNETETRTMTPPTLQQ